jgi:hypothetical protein
MDSLKTSQVLPISGCIAVFAHQPDGRNVLELQGPAGEPLGVFSNSPVDASPLRGGWRGRSGKSGNWAIAIGLRADSEPTLVSFHSRRRFIAPASQVQPPAAALGDFWVAEVTGAYNRVTVRAAGRESSLQLAPIRREVVS